MSFIKCCLFVCLTNFVGFGDCDQGDMRLRGTFGGGGLLAVVYLVFLIITKSEAQDDDSLAGSFFSGKN